MIAVTGATGHLGRLVVEQLLTSAKVAPAEVVAIVRDASKASDLAARGVQVRVANYDSPSTIEAALAGVDKLLLVSGNEMGKRIGQHTAVIDAGKKVGVGLIAYTSILHAETSGISLAVEHLATEKVLRASGVGFVLLRNGWYLENYTENLAPALEHGAMQGASKEGKIAAAARADYAAAAVKVLTTSGHANKVYELAGDEGFTKAQLAAEVAKQSGKPVAYVDLAPKDFTAALESVGLPKPFAEMLTSADEGIARGELDVAGHALRELIGRPTATLAQAVTAALKT